MKKLATLLLPLGAAAGVAFSAQAQGPHFRLPEQCSSSTAGAMDHSSHSSGHSSGGHGDHADMERSEPDLEAMPEHVRENMSKMEITVPAMHAGMMIEDPDVAFACAMIPHHQGAIDMAEVLLEYGKDPQMRALAEEIIESQQAEIEQMKKWLAERAK